MVRIRETAGIRDKVRLGLELELRLVLGLELKLRVVFLGSSLFYVH